ncbi:hypothetical protein N7532_010111 [Penicillium argentinense]|uniref:DUF4396 domain-containing protein n=1 Tax=Penicillium argentinense TaxID=1131581 RepID=A0A9W9EP54_9EURO|nr:uncharacterized protein N7532_010111 [Penicillium argentinense]KAJ5085340.1 hypothetical protein N7532_010111 [Penicillium argentinense]
MYQTKVLLQSRLTARAASSDFRRALSSSSAVQSCCSGKKSGSMKPISPSVSNKLATAGSKPIRSSWKLNFWTHRPAWKRAGLNTLRCLVGCSVGDFSALWMLQSYCPELGMGSIMMASMASGITTSIILETILLRRGADQLSWPMAARTAMGMSMVSMVAMELAENMVDYHLTGGQVNFEDPQFWIAAGLSIGAGFLAPLPYNYLRLRKYGRACH